LIFKKDILVITYIVCFLLPIYAFAQTSEYTIKAAFLERFTRFIEWPAESTVHDTTKVFVLGIVGDNPFGTVLDKLYATQKIKNKKVQILYISNLNDILKCNIIFISKSKANDLLKILLLTKNQPILTVSDTNGFAENGVLINFFFEENKIRFEINETAVKNSELSISYLLYNVAKIINPIENKR
jgi:hypothetical protein